MARQVATTVENNFVLGLVTERTELRFPQNASPDLDNCVIDLYGRISRRPGLDIEGNPASTFNVATAQDSWTEFLWEAAGNSSTTLYVHQHGRYISVYDLSSDVQVSTNIVATTIDLNSYIPAGSGENPAIHPCQFASGFGKLIITNSATSSLLVEFDGSLLTITSILPQIRDFEGLDDGLGQQERPTDSVSSLSSGKPKHYYNILNQGWFSGDALSQWDTARTDMPSNADVLGFYRASATDSFDNSIVTSKFPGSVSAPKGHFILDAFNPNRTAAAAAEGFTATVDTVTLVDRTLGTNIGNMTNLGGLSASFNGVTVDTQGGSSGANTSSGYVGKNYTSPGGSKIFGVNITFPTDWTPAVGVSRVYTLYGKSTSPSSSTDGTILGSATVASTVKTPLFIASNDTATTFNYFWVQCKFSNNASNALYFTELQFYSAAPSTSSVTYKRPSTCAFFQGRAFYSGVDDTKNATKILFTRIIENDDHYNQCYSDNDPAAETLNDFLPSDGGVISIPECGIVNKLVVTEQSLLILASNGIWLVGGSGGQPFQATNYTVTKLSGIGCQAPRSYVDYKGTPIWWGDEGIYTVQFDPNYNSYQVVDTTIDNIRTFITDIPPQNRQYVKGAYDIENDIVYFLYNDTAGIYSTVADTYNKALISVPRSKAFYPWSFGDSDFYIRGISYLRDGARSQTPVIKFVFSDTTGSVSTGGTCSVYWGQCDSATYKDFSTYANTISHNSNDEIDYSSYFITGYYIHGETQRFFQGNYLFMFVDQDNQGSARVRTIADWTTTGNSGKWSAFQQIYPDWQDLQKINYRRLKTRGKGRAMQIYVESDSGKPFSILGWSVWETGNTTI